MWIFFLFLRFYFQITKKSRITLNVFHSPQENLLSIICYCNSENGKYSKNHRDYQLCHRKLQGVSPSPHVDTKKDFYCLDTRRLGNQTTEVVRFLHIIYRTLGTYMFQSPRDFIRNSFYVVCIFTYQQDLIISSSDFSSEEDIVLYYYYITRVSGSRNQKKSADLCETPRQVIYRLNKIWFRCTINDNAILNESVLH